METAVLGGGCFWCIEAVFKRVEGVCSVMPGYAGGWMQDPDYESVCSGRTGHAEVVEIKFDPAVTSYADLLKFFWKAHDPTTPDRQGNDRGSQYRSIILAVTDNQLKTAVASRAEAQKDFDQPIVTEIRKLERFYPAERYHYDYYDSNADQPYCALVIAPKLKKLGL